MSNTKLLDRISEINKRAEAVFIRLHRQAHKAGKYEKRDAIYEGAVAAGQSACDQCSDAEWAALQHMLREVG